MYPDKLINKLIMGGLTFLIMLSVACVLWYRHNTIPYKKSAAESEEMLRQLEIKQKVSDTDSEIEQTIDRGPADSTTQTTEKTLTETTTVEKNIAPAETPSNLGKQTQGVEKAKAVGVSPHGFGPFPEVPEAYIKTVETPPWIQTEKYGAPPGERNQELMSRVMLKLWKEGHTTVESATMRNERILVNYKNRAYVTYGTRISAEGKPVRYFTSWLSGSLEPPTVEFFSPVDEDSLLPPSVELIDLDVEDLSIDPYKFLELSP